MLVGFLKISGMLVLRLVYGKEYIEKYSEKIGLMILLSVANSFWLLCGILLLSGNAAKDTALCGFIVFSYPVAIAIWTAVVRNKQDT